MGVALGDEPSWVGMSLATGVGESPSLWLGRGAGS